MQKTNLPVRYSGITTIEFSVVILILCLLIFAALRYFGELNESTNNLIVKTNFRSFTIGVQVAHAQWLMNHQTPELQLEDTMYFFNAEGWPGRASMSTADCETIWHTVLVNQIPAEMNAPFTLAKDVGVYRMNGLCVYLFRLELTHPRGILYNPEDGKTMLFGVSSR